MRIIVTITVAVLLHTGILQSVCGSQSMQPDHPAEEIRLALVSTTQAVLAGVAHQKGYFEQAGLKVIARQHSFGKSAMEDLLQGNADVATVADAPIMMEIMKGAKICVIATIQSSNADNAIVAMRDDGIPTLGDLRGWKIGTSLGTSSDFFLDAFLVAHGISPKEVEKVDLGPEQMHDALVNGDINAASAFQPFLAMVENHLGNRVVSFYDENIYTWTFSIVALQDFVRRNPENIRQFLDALVRAEKFVNNNRKEAQQIVAGYSGMSIDLVRKIWSRMRFSVTLDQLLVLALEDESRWAISSGLVGYKKIPNYLDYMYFEGLESVKPGAVRILGRKATGD